MATISLSYSAWTALTLSVASLGSSSDFTAGRESTVVDNSTNLYVDALVAGRVTVGTTPTINTQIIIYAFAVRDTGTYPDVMDGTDSAETLTSVVVGRGFLVPIATLTVDETVSDQAYDFGPVSLVAAFGYMPQRWGLFVAHNTVAALNSTGGNHEFKYTGIKYTSA